MIQPYHRLVSVLLVALSVAAPALAATPPGIDNATDSGVDNPGLDVTRHAMPPPDATKPAEAHAVSANPLWAIPLSALESTHNRPLFTQSRRPPAPIVASVPVARPPPPPPPPPAPEHLNLVLVGTVAAENEGVAVFIDPSTRNALRLRTGEAHLGWILQSVDHRTATLQKGGQSETLELPRPTDLRGPAPVVSTLPPGPMPRPPRPLPPVPPPPQMPPPPVHSNVPAPANPPQRGGCMPEPIGC